MLLRPVGAADKVVRNDLTQQRGYVGLIGPRPATRLELLQKVLAALRVDAGAHVLVEQASGAARLGEEHDGRSLSLDCTENHAHCGDVAVEHEREHGRGDVVVRYVVLGDIVPQLCSHLARGVEPRRTVVDEKKVRVARVERELLLRLARWRNDRLACAPEKRVRERVSE
eukprot:3354042-Pleurochrysis_carterae.AAC.1